MSLRFLLIVSAVAMIWNAGAVRAQQVPSNDSDAHTRVPSQSAPATSKPKIVIDPSLRNDPTAIVVWIAYGVWLGLHHPKLDSERAAGLHVYVPTFDADLLARENQIAVWNQIKAKDASVSNPYMAQIEKINKAGFLREYVWEYCKQSAWTKPDDLKLAQFDAWRQRHLRSIKAETHAHLAI
jgi:hypothetical protein